MTEEQREEVARILETIATDGLPHPRHLDSALDAITDIQFDAIRALEAKLAKAVEALRYYAVEAMPWDADDSLIARTALAEIESPKQ